MEYEKILEEFEKDYASLWNQREWLKRHELMGSSDLSDKEFIELEKQASVTRRLHSGHQALRTGFVGPTNAGKSYVLNQLALCRDTKDGKISEGFFHKGNPIRQALKHKKELTYHPFFPVVSSSILSRGGGGGSGGGGLTQTVTFIAANADPLDTRIRFEIILPDDGVGRRHLEIMKRYHKERGINAEGLEAIDPKKARKAIYNELNNLFTAELRGTQNADHEGNLRFDGFDYDYQVITKDGEDIPAALEKGPVILRIHFTGTFWDALSKVNYLQTLLNAFLANYEEHTEISEGGHATSVRPCFVNFRISGPFTNLREQNLVLLDMPGLVDLVTSRVAASAYHFERLDVVFVVTHGRQMEERDLALSLPILEQRLDELPQFIYLWNNFRAINEGMHDALIESVKGFEAKPLHKLALQIRKTLQTQSLRMTLEKIDQTMFLAFFASQQVYEEVMEYDPQFRDQHPLDFSLHFKRARLFIIKQKLPKIYETMRIAAFLLSNKVALVHGMDPLTTLPVTPGLKQNSLIFPYNNWVRNGRNGYGNPKVGFADDALVKPATFPELVISAIQPLPFSELNPGLDITANINIIRRELDAHRLLSITHEILDHHRKTAIWRALAFMAWQFVFQAQKVPLSGPLDAADGMVLDAGDAGMQGLTYQRYKAITNNRDWCEEFEFLIRLMGADRAMTQRKLRIIEEKNSGAQKRPIRFIAAKDVQDKSDAMGLWRNQAVERILEINARFAWQAKLLSVAVEKELAQKVNGYVNSLASTAAQQLRDRPNSKPRIRFEIWFFNEAKFKIAVDELTLKECMVRFVIPYALPLYELNQFREFVYAKPALQSPVKLDAMRDLQWSLAKNYRGATAVDDEILRRFSGDDLSNISFKRFGANELPKVQMGAKTDEGLAPSNEDIEQFRRSAKALPADLFEFSPAQSTNFVGLKQDAELMKVMTATIKAPSFGIRLEYGGTALAPRPIIKSTLGKNLLFYSKDLIAEHLLKGAPTLLCTYLTLTEVTALDQAPVFKLLCTKGALFGDQPRLILLFIPNLDSEKETEVHQILRGSVGHVLVISWPNGALQKMGMDFPACFVSFVAQFARALLDMDKLSGIHFLDPNALYIRSFEAQPANDFVPHCLLDAQAFLQSIGKTKSSPDYLDFNAETSKILGNVSEERNSLAELPPTEKGKDAIGETSRILKLGSVLNEIGGPKLTKFLGEHETAIAAYANDPNADEPPADLVASADKNPSAKAIFAFFNTASIDKQHKIPELAKKKKMEYHTGGYHLKRFLLAALRLIGSSNHWGYALQGSNKTDVSPLPTLERGNCQQVPVPDRASLVFIPKGVITSPSSKRYPATCTDFQSLMRDFCLLTNDGDKSVFQVNNFDVFLSK